MQKPNDDLHQINVTFIKTISEWFNGHAQRGDLKQLTWDIFMPLLLGPSQDYAKYYLAGLPVSPVDTAVEAFGDAAWKSLKN